MAENTVSFPYLALDKFSGNDPDQNAKSFLPTLENKINFSLGSRPVDNAERGRYLFRKKAPFPSTALLLIFPYYITSKWDPEFNFTK